MTVELTEKECAMIVSVFEQVNVPVKEAQGVLDLLAKLKVAETAVE